MIPTTYIYDPRRSMLVVFEDDKPTGGYIGQIAERKIEQLLLTDAMIQLGEFLTAQEIKDRANLNTR